MERHRSEITGVDNKACRLTVTLSWLIETLEKNRDIVNVISYIRVFPAMTAGKKPLLLSRIYVLSWNFNKFFVKLLKNILY